MLVNKSANWWHAILLCNKKYVIIETNLYTRLDKPEFKRVIVIILLETNVMINYYRLSCYFQRNYQDLK